VGGKGRRERENEEGEREKGSDPVMGRGIYAKRIRLILVLRHVVIKSSAVPSISKRISVDAAKVGVTEWLSCWNFVAYVTTVVWRSAALLASFRLRSRLQL
jgi:hypothetical protein